VIGDEDVNRSERCFDVVDQPFWSIWGCHVEFTEGVPSIEPVIRGRGVRRSPLVPHRLVDQSIVAHARQHPIW
jgi:hypothetical protein